MLFNFSELLTELVTNSPFEKLPMCHSCERGKSDLLSKTLSNCLVLQSHSLPTLRTRRRGFLCPARSVKPAMTPRMLSSKRLWWSDINCSRYAFNSDLRLSSRRVISGFQTTRKHGCLLVSEESSSSILPEYSYSLAFDVSTRISSLPSLSVTLIFLMLNPVICDRE
jgi:hypothetical protein